MTLTARKHRLRIDWKIERERVDLAAVVMRLIGPASGRRGQSGRKLWWNCPLHEDRNPSFCVEPGKPWWRCYGCRESGDAATLVMKLEAKSFPEALDFILDGSAPSGKATTRSAKAPNAKPTPEPTGLREPDALTLVVAAERLLWHGTDGPPSAPPLVENGEKFLVGRSLPYLSESRIFLAAKSVTREGADALAYLTGPSRGLSPATIRAARLGWTAQADGVAWNPPGVVIPWFTGDRLALVKIRPPEAWREQYQRRFPDRTQPPKYIEAFRATSRLVCYPDPATIRPGRPLIVVEGEFDALALGEALRDMASVVTLGSASAELPSSLITRILVASLWFIATDSDPAGDKFATRWNSYPRAHRVRPPSPYKDWSEAWQDGVNLARWWRDFMTGRRLRTDARGNMTPELFTHEEATAWRWGSAPGGEGLDYLNEQCTPAIELAAGQTEVGHPNSKGGNDGVVS